MADQPRRRRIEAADPGGDPVCLLTADAARRRRVPIDRLLEVGDFASLANGYEVRLPAGAGNWTLANEFAEEEASCCPALAVEIEERERAIVVRSTFT